MRLEDKEDVLGGVGIPGSGGGTWGWDGGYTSGIEPRGGTGGTRRGLNRLQPEVVGRGRWRVKADAWCHQTYLFVSTLHFPHVKPRDDVCVMRSL